MTSAAVYRVRGHHLLCLMTYVGRGYSPQFVAAMDTLAKHVARDGLVELCIGPDMLCGALTDAPRACAEHCHLARNTVRDQTALVQMSQLLGARLHAGMTLALTARTRQALRARLRRLDTRRSTKGLRQACVGCEWLGLCRTVSVKDFRDARLGYETRGTQAASARKERPG